MKRERDVEGSSSDGPSSAQDGRAQRCSADKPDGLRPVLVGEKVVLYKGIRHVRHYYDDFITHSKRRWIGRTIVDVFSKEFLIDDVDPQRYLRWAIEAGRILVNGKKASTEFCFGENQQISHRVHRHEKEILNDPIKVVAETEDFWVVDKPASVPCHPCGRYCVNSLTEIWQKEMRMPQAFVVHRLDRLTSGLLLLGKSGAAAARLSKMFADRQVRKMYLARVKGRFVNGNAALAGDGEAAERLIDCPIAVASHADGIYRAAPRATPAQKDVWEAKTVVSQFCYFPSCDESVVCCRPLTGRSHQIRVHLQYIGHPIVNDPHYGSCLDDADREESVENKRKRIENSRFERLYGCPSRTEEPHIIAELRGVLDPDCPECQKPFVVHDRSSLFICLHAWRYDLNSQTFESDLPAWATHERC